MARLAKMFGKPAKREFLQTDAHTYASGTAPFVPRRVSILLDGIRVKKNVLCGLLRPELRDDTTDTESPRSPRRGKTRGAGQARADGQAMVTQPADKRRKEQAAGAGMAAGAACVSDRAESG
jgi:hypothetical protein